MRYWPYEKCGTSRRNTDLKNKNLIITKMEIYEDMLCTRSYEKDMSKCLEKTYELLIFVVWRLDKAICHQP